MRIIIGIGSVMCHESKLQKSLDKMILDSEITVYLTNVFKEQFTPRSAEIDDEIIWDSIIINIAMRAIT